LALLALLPLGRALARVALLLRDDFAFKLLLAVNCFAFLIFEKRCKNLPKKTLRIFFILTFHPPTILSHYSLSVLSFCFISNIDINIIQAASGIKITFECKYEYIFTYTYIFSPS